MPVVSAQLLVCTLRWAEPHQPGGLLLDGESVGEQAQPGLWGHGVRGAASVAPSRLLAGRA